MSSQLTIAFPTDFEAAELLTKLGSPPAKSVSGLTYYEAKSHGATIHIAILGMGPQLASQRATVIVQSLKPATLVVAGFCGSLVPQLTIGHIVVADELTPPDLLQHIRLLPGYSVVHLCTSSTVLTTAAEKAHLATTTRCQVVDMESAHVVEQAQGIPTLVVRAISDDSNEDLPAQALAHGYDAEKGVPTAGRLVWYLATHPREIAPFVRFVKKLPAVRTKLTSFLLELIPELI